MTWEELPAETWRGFRRPGFPDQSWGVESGILHARADADPIDLISRGVYRNFVLSLEWMLPTGGNSGIIYRVSEDWEESWQSGPEMQLLDDRGHPDGRRPETSCGAFYDVHAPVQSPVPEAGSFHTAQLSVRGSVVEHRLDKMRVLAYDLSDPATHRKINQSKFRDNPRFGRQREGHVVLQHHHTDAWFRNIRIQVLSG